jgi:hypothetical protein
LLCLEVVAVIEASWVSGDRRVSVERGYVDGGAPDVVVLTVGGVVVEMPREEFVTLVRMIGVG